MLNVAPVAVQVRPAPLAESPPVRSRRSTIVQEVISALLLVVGAVGDVLTA